MEGNTAAAAASIRANAPACGAPVGRHPGPNRHQPPLHPHPIAALLMPAVLVALIELPATGASVLWSVLAVGVTCGAVTWLGWDATRPN